ncbi:MAG: hypothetical protein A3J54_02970 [Candidatus Ryanbacteria bacterium RIFCSPHIGHO2_02_FULL_45_13b]|uniref:Beta-glucosidase n=1 Tax=Candidatus Ryanbacteria bacterium RIFCSPHIGHO2_02_FULL_45_13b TaxID=1802117 RepID=A0A1G2G7K6_9BACT|nr:MAG: hypothetical protein A3J54_02970 [Candidatus Ryanbacteria bacterium RIFCSPHIGHO2_02_FULL_45_13b]
MEGGNVNDWSVWEKENAERLSRESGGKYPPENYISGKACDHYNRYEEDFDIAQKLGHNAHRFSIEWSRVEPEEGKFDDCEIEHYRQVIKALRARGMEPLVTLWHWSLPLWLADKGGVLAEDFSSRFRRYAERVCEGVGNDVRFWITINEPEIYALNSYFLGKWPPQKRGPISFFRATYALNVAHHLAYRVIKKHMPNTVVGVAVNQSYFESAGGVVNDILTWEAERLWNRRFLWHVSDELDFIGLNYYFHNRIDYGFNKNTNKKISDMGHELYPEGLYHLLIGLKQFQKPIYITENGLADTRDEHRAWFIREHIRWMKKAMDEGADVRSYLHWSLLDNFEWDKGFWPRFGLVEIDYKTMERKIRSSAWEYKKIIEEGV